jgi:hypothetical protein
MRYLLLPALIVGSAAAILCSSCSRDEKSAQQPQPPQQPPVSGERSSLVSVSGKVEAIDLANREITLKDGRGDTVTFVVDERVKRLDEVKVGDTVTADYYISLAGEVRPPTEDEKKNPLVIVEGGGRAPAGSAPAAGVMRTIRVVAKVVAIDLPAQSVTLQGPRGNTGAITVENPDNLKRIHLGDNVIVTYTEALAVSLEKETTTSRRE